MILLISCQSCPEKIKSEVIPFPDPIDSTGRSVVIYEEETDTVSMPYWYWFKIVDYAILNSP